MSYRNLRPGQFVKYLIPNGLSLYDEVMQEWRSQRSKIVMVFDDHVVVNGNGRYGTPRVVDERNILL